MPAAFAVALLVQQASIWLHQLSQAVVMHVRRQSVASTQATSNSSDDLATKCTSIVMAHQDAWLALQVLKRAWLQRHCRPLQLHKHCFCCAGRGCIRWLPAQQLVQCVQGLAAHWRVHVTWRCCGLCVHGLTPGCLTDGQRRGEQASWSVSSGKLVADANHA